MKKLLPLFGIILFLAVLAIIIISLAKKDATITVVKNNTSFKPLPIKLHKTNDTECAMLIEKNENAAEAIAPDGTTWFFDDPGCLAKWLEKKKWKKEAKLWVYTVDTKRWIDAKKAKYLTTYHSAMHYGFGAVEKEHNNTIDFEQMRLRMLRNQTLANPKYRKKILGE